MIRKISMLLSLCLFLVWMNPLMTTAAVPDKEKKKVDIVLKEYTLDKDGREVPWKDVEYALPGQKIIKIPRVTNLESECKIRAKIEVTMGKEVEMPVTAAMLEGMPEEWKKREDGWYYYERPFKKGESADLFTSFTIPAQWDTRYGKDGEIEKYYTENKIDIVVTVEAAAEEEDFAKPDKVIVSPKTGDRTESAEYILLCFGALIFIGGLLRRKRT